MNYYNEFDPHAAQWLRNLIAAGYLPAGDVDERSIEDVRPDDLRGYVQCHFFAGIGGWPHALALDGWPSDRPVWTGSCPCQPFSAAGKGAGFEDERHLWPAWQHLIAQCRPAIVFGEQVASKSVGPWIDLVHADLENLGYAFGCVPFPAASVGAPHIRDRSYWVADLRSAGLAQRVGNGRVQREALGASARQAVIGGGDARGMANTDGWHACTEWQQRSGQQRQQPQDGFAGGLADAHVVPGGQRSSFDAGRHPRSDAKPRTGLGCGGLLDGDRPGPTNGQWRAADWLLCTDGKWRPVEPGLKPLAHGSTGRVGKLRAYGNCIVPAQAAEFITAYAEAVSVVRLERAA